MQLLARHRPKRTAKGQGEVRRHARQIRSSVGRQLNEIVRESTERWLMPTADADREYYEELCAMGYQVEEAEERMQERGREYHGMISMGCTRQAQHVPRRIPNMDHVLVRSVAAGYAHVMLLSDAGQLYAAGYNDRGQLGLGHRINTSEFKQVDFLSNKLVLQVVCGQQHTICRAIDSHSGASNAAAGANAYVWGNGILGQLGIGVRGTSKGRLLPTLVDLLFKQYPCGIVDVGAGGNFTVAVTSDGQVYSFGHAEYNQHGTGNRANNDYIDPHFYFVPRNIMDAIQPRDKQRICIRSVHCGQNYTIGVDEAGDVYSWGWNESGVLGHGLHHYSAEPTRVQSIGGYVGRKVLGVAAGAKHVLVLAQTQCNSWARRFAPPDASLSDEAAASEFVDCYLQCEGGAVSLPCHKAVLAARSHYLRGFILAAEADSDERQPVRVPLGSASAASAKVLLEYIYKDTAPATSNPRQRLQLVSLAAELLVTQLQSGLGLQTGYHSSYVLDMTALLACSQHADMVFTASASLVAPRLPDEKTEVALAHRVVVSRIPYYAALLGGRFADSHRLEAAGDRQQRRYEVDIDGLLRDGISVESFRALLHFAYTGELVIAGSSSDESALSESQLDSVMNILVAANRLGFQLLALQCERKLSTHLGLLSRLSVEGCLQFAQAYNLGRLEKQCVAALSRKA
mmetsp:Transcript_18907/g.26037  ORF Transcript_18907/g.26037 Transcript_18907/m.26037 type:complete len:685 (+) Transcript_18907:511-2565(+)